MKSSIVLWIAGTTAIVSLAGMGAVSGLTKDVTLVVDGQATSLRVNSDTVEQVLAQHDVTLTPRDAVTPAPASHIANGMRIVVSYGRQVDVTVDGVPQTVWTTGATVDGVLAGMGITDPDALVAPDRSTPLTGDGLAITVSLPKLVQVTADGSTTTMETTASTVGDLLAAQGVEIGPQDAVTPSLDTPLSDTTTISVQRVTTSQQTETVEVPYGTTKQNDATLAQGTTKVATPGANGSKNQVWQVTSVDGVAQSKTLISESVTKQPTNEVVLVGTKQPTPSAPPTVAAPNVTPGSAQAIAQGLLASYGFGQDQFGCLVSLWNRESGWRVNAANRSSGAYGIPQALPGSKMASAGPNWQTDAATQIRWGLGYIKGRYGSPCGAWSFSQGHGWY
ncbi:MAG: ubiquitin-like domain-containing protein [Propionibacteriaceae bacterium]|nr:ubiquitin-like domain-containing protein [Propionibacteriaceae bacterium]